MSASAAAARDRRTSSQVKGDVVMGRKFAVVVTGGTGNQSGAVVKSLLERGREVRAVARNTDSGERFDVASDELSGNDVVAILSHVLQWV